MNLNKNAPFDIVEFGPGSGALIATILKTLCKFPTGSSLFRRLHLIERSDYLRQKQETVIYPLLKTLHLKPEVKWHSSIDDVPRGCSTYYLAHEFLDALPVHRFQLAGDLSGKNCVEVCPEAGAIVQKLAARIAADGGAALVIDYGHCGEKGDTLRAFKNHQLHDPLRDPGEADITADVDFAFLHRSIEATKEQVIVHGPVSQAYFLVHMGILMRVKVCDLCLRFFLHRSFQLGCGTHYSITVCSP
uniref:Protein arginine methyltransferase NDUFAF7 n=1 Tax=Mesocestoides corti TaxID=53468 RepID=A0A5K3FJA5_MESCO